MKVVRVRFRPHQFQGSTTFVVGLFYFYKVAKLA